MNVAGMLQFFQDNPPRDYSRGFQGNPDAEKKDFKVTPEKMKAAIGDRTVTSKSIVALLGLKERYASRVLTNYCKREYLIKDGSIPGTKGTKPLIQYKWNPAAKLDGEQ